MLIIKNRAAQKLIFFLALATLLAGCRPRGPQSLLDGKSLIERGRYAEAIEKLKTATSLIGTNAQAWNYLGLAYHYAHQASNAAQAYQIALNRDHDLTETHYNLGCLWLEQNRLEAARTEFTVFTLHRENAVDGWLKLATTQLRLRDSAAAEKSFKEALRISSQNPEALNGLGLVQVQRSRAPDAAQYFSDALKQRPDFAPALLNLAIVSQQYLNKRQFALQTYREYLALPSRPANWDEVNVTARALEQEFAPVRPTPTNAAPTVVAKAPETKPSTNAIPHLAPTPKPEAPSSLAKNLPATNRVVEPVRVPPEPVVKPAQTVSVASAPRTASDSASDRTVQQNSSANPAAREGRAASGPATAPGPAIEGVAASNSFPRYRYRSPAAPGAGNRSTAEKAYAQGVEAQRAGHLAEAIQAYREAVQSDPAYYEAYYNLGVAATSASNLPQALLAYELALAVRSDSLDARYNFAYVLKQAGYVIDSVNELERLAAAYPNEARVHLLLGNLYAQQLALPSRAREHYMKVLQTDPQNPKAGDIREWLVSNSR